MIRIVFMCIIFLVGCETVAPYQKEFFLKDLMTDSVFKTDSLFRKETFKSDSSGSESACPTCG